MDDTDSHIPEERSKSKISDKGPLSFNSEPHHISDPKTPLSEKDQIAPPEIDFDDLDSINENIPAARATELRRLREENHELKERLKQTNKIKQDVPLAMTTFSPRKEPSTADLHPSLTDAKD